MAKHAFVPLRLLLKVVSSTILEGCDNPSVLLHVIEKVVG